MTCWLVPLLHGWAALRRIDLVCLFAAPIFTGTLMTFRGLRDASVALAAWNVVAWGPQVLLLRRAARMARLDELSGEEGAVPAEEVGEAAGRTAFDPDGRGDTGEYEDGKEGVVPPAWYPGNLISNALGRLKVFWRQRMALAMLALAMLYFSVLSLGLIMTSYLKCAASLTSSQLLLIQAMLLPCNTAEPLTHAPGALLQVERYQ